MKKLLILLTAFIFITGILAAQTNVGVGTTSPNALLHVKKLSSSNTFAGTTSTVIVEDSGSTILHIAGRSGSLADKTGILISDKPYQSAIHFYGPTQQLNIGVLGRNQLIVNNNGIVVHDMINNPAVVNSAALQVSSFNRGVLLPNLDLTQRNAIANPATSLLVYQTDNDSGFYYNTSVAGAPAWKKLITTADLNPITIKPAERRVGINTTSPTGLLHIKNTDAQDKHIVLQDLFRATEASMQFFNRHFIFQTTEAAGSFWDFNSNTGITQIRLSSNGDIDMSGDLTLGPFRKLGVNTDEPSAPVHVLKNDVSGGSFNARSLMILEDNDHGYLQFSNPNNKEAGILSGNVSTGIRSALIFGPDSSVAIRTGGNSTKVFVTKTGEMGIGTAAPEARLDVDGTVKLGTNGTPINGIIKTIVNADVAAIAANATLAKTFSVPGATTTSVVYVSPKNVLPAGVVIAYSRVSTTGVVEVTFLNTTNASLDPLVMDYVIGVVM